MTNRGKYISKMYSKKRDAKEVKISEVLSFFLNYYHIDSCVKEDEIIQAWKDITGEFIFKMTKKIYVQKSCLYIYVDSPGLKNELMLVRTDILKKIKDKVENSGLNNIYIK